MGSFHDRISLARNQSPPPVVAKLEGVFEALDDTDLLHALKGKTHRGCQGYSVEALWRSYLVAYVQNIPSVSALIRYLIDQPYVAEACGLIAIPSDATYSRFVTKLAKHSALVEQTMKKGVAVLRENLPNFGKGVAIDSTDILAYSQTHKPTDPDAAWGRKRKHSRPYWWFGYKAHVVCDVLSELPIHVEVTLANIADVQMFKGPLAHANTSPNYVAVWFSISAAWVRRSSQNAADVSRAVLDLPR